MSKKPIFTFVLVLCLSFVVIGVRGHNPGYYIVAVYGLTPSIDGIIHDWEWSDATSISFSNTEVFVKQDGVNLYIGFNVFDSTYSQWDSTAIYIDVENDGNTYLQPDDHAFAVHRNGTLAEANVTASNFQFTTVSGWTAQTFTVLNWWQVEFNITYAKINVVAGNEKTIGAAFGKSDNGTYPSTWPSTGFILLSPATWGDITSTGYNWVPEFPSLVILPLFTISALLTALVCRVKRIYCRFLKNKKIDKV